MLEGWMWQKQWKRHQKTRILIPVDLKLYANKSLWECHMWNIGHAGRMRLILTILARGICKQDSQLGIRGWSLKGELRLWVCHNLWCLPQNGWSSWGGWIHLHDISSKRSFLTTLPKILTPFPTVLCWFMFLVSTSWFNSIHICLLLSISLQRGINSMRAEILTVIPPHCYIPIS